MLRCRSILFVPTAFLLMITWPALGQRSPDPDSPRYKAALALDAMLSSEGGHSLSDFVDHQVSPLMVNREGRGELLSRLSELRRRFAQMGLRGARPEGPFSARLVFAGEGQSQALVFRVEEEPPHRFLEIGLGEGTGDRPGNGAGAQGEQGVQPEPFLDRQALANAVETRMEQAVSQGYSASVLVARGSEVLLEKGYGMANREKEIATTPETLFDVGSIGKVFTRVAIQKLREQGRLQLSDRLVRFFPEVPQ
ncbi:MAG TPA: serine hydrolase domain-containing protein, partial [Acidobacteriota bacterium]|nr:serine hydrolase domain-containing protein [Acidobacteriota bacterium]